MGKTGLIAKAYDALASKAKETGAALFSVAPEIKEYIPGEWSAAPAQEPTLSIPAWGYMAAAYLALDAGAAYQIAKHEKKDADRIPTIGPISAITRKLKHGSYLGEKMEYKPTD